MKKRVFSALLALCLAFSLFGTALAAVAEPQGDSAAPAASGLPEESGGGEAAASPGGGDGQEMEAEEPEGAAAPSAPSGASSGQPSGQDGARTDQAEETGGAREPQTEEGSAPTEEVPAPDGEMAVQPAAPGEEDGTTVQPGAEGEQTSGEVQAPAAEADGQGDAAPADGERDGGSDDISLTGSEEAPALPANGPLPTVDTVDSIAEGVHMYLFNYSSSNGPFTGGEYYDGNNANKGHVWQGIASSTTGGGQPLYYLNFPTLNSRVTDARTGATQSVSPTGGYTGSFRSFFNPENGVEVNGLFWKDRFEADGTFYYSAFDTFATIVSDACTVDRHGALQFKVYDALGAPESSVLAGQAYRKPSSAYFYFQRGNFLPYNDLDAADLNTYAFFNESGQQITGDYQEAETIYGLLDEDGRPLSKTSGADAEYQFGLYLYASFYQPKDGRYNGRDMVYQFTGDDDLWIYIDGVLVLDLGGEHDALSGSINFTTGTVSYQYAANANGVQTGTTTIREMFRAAGAENGTRWDPERDDTFADGTAHTIQMFYMERGGGASNLKMSFNLPTIPDGTLSVRKDVEHYFDAQMRDIEYVMQLLDGDGSPMAGEPYYIFGEDYGSQADWPVTDADGCFALRHDQTAIFEGIGGEERVTIREVGVRPEDENRIDGYETAYVVTDSTGNTTGSGSGQDAELTMPAAGSANVVFTNTARFTAPLTVTKSFAISGLEDCPAPEGFEAAFTVYRMDGEEAAETVGSVSYSDFVDGSYTFWLEEGASYQVVEAIAAAGETAEGVIYLRTTVVTTDSGASTTAEGTGGTVTLEQNSGGDAHRIAFTNVYGQPTGSLTIRKAVAGLDGARLEELLEQLTFTVTDGGGYTADYTLSEVEPAQDGTYSITIPDLPAGAYTVTERGGQVEGFTWTVAPEGGSRTVEVPAGGNGTAEFTNRYTRSDYTLTVNKWVDGTAGETDRDFAFTLTLTDTLSQDGAGQDRPYRLSQLPEGLYATESDGVYTFSLKDRAANPAEGTIGITLPYGVTAVVEEADAGAAGYEAASRQYRTPAQGEEAGAEYRAAAAQTVTAISADCTVDFRNSRDAAVPTGLAGSGSRMAPFWILTGCAACVGTALVGGLALRRRRRH